VFGFLNPKSDRAKKKISFVRGIFAISLVVPSLMMMIFGSKWIGWAVSRGLSTDYYKLIPVSPVICGLFGISLFFIALNVLRHEKNIIKEINRRHEKEVKGRRSFLENRSDRLSRLILICALLMVITMYLLPIFVINYDLDGENATLMLSLQETGGKGFTEEFTEVVDNIANFQLIGWFTFSIALFMVFSELFYLTKWAPLTGNILLLCGNAIIITLILQMIFKSIGVFKTFDLNSKIGDEGTIFYGFNYLPTLAMLGLIIVSIFFAISSIKGMARFLKGSKTPAAEKEFPFPEDLYTAESPTAQKYREIEFDYPPKRFDLDFEDW
jgi:hypothetical protein